MNDNFVKSARKYIFERDALVAEFTASLPELLPADSYSGNVIFQARELADMEIARKILDQQLNVAHDNVSWHSKVSPTVADEISISMARIVTIAASNPDHEAGQKLLENIERKTYQLRQQGKFLQLRDYLAAKGGQKTEVLLKSGDADAADTGFKAMVDTVKEKAEPIKKAYELGETHVLKLKKQVVGLDVVAMGKAGLSKGLEQLSNLDHKLPAISALIKSKAVRLTIEAGVVAGVAAGLVVAGVALAPMVAPFALSFAISAGAVASHVGGAILHSTALKFASIVGGPIFALYKEYNEAPKDLLYHIKNKDRYADDVMLSEIYDKQHKSDVATIMSKSGLTLAQQTQEIKASRKLCGTKTIDGVKNSLGVFYSSASSWTNRADISMSDTWKLRKLLNYQSFDQLQKLTADFDTNRKLNGMGVKEAMEAAVITRMSDPEFKLINETAKSHNRANIAIAVASGGIGLIANALLGGHGEKVAEAASAVTLGLTDKVVDFVKDKVKDYAKDAATETATNVANALATNVVASKLIRMRDAKASGEEIFTFSKRAPT
jgi:hypothetical protein